MSLCPCRRELRSQTRMAMPSSSAFISTRQNVWVRVVLKRTFIAARACRSLRPFIIMSREGHRRPIAECVAAVSMSCEKQQFLQCLWNAVFSRIRPKESTCKLLLTVKSLQRRLRRESVDVILSAARGARHEWRRAKASRCNRTSIKPTCRNLKAITPSVRTKKARERRKAHPNRRSRRQAPPQKRRRANLNSPILTSAQMRAAEGAAFARGVEVEALMDKAGAGVSQAVSKFFPNPGKCIVFAGKGHNAGDALVAAQCLR